MRADTTWHEQLPCVGSDGVPSPKHRVPVFLHPQRAERHRRSFCRSCNRVLMVHHEQVTSESGPAREDTTPASGILSTVLESISFDHD
jgi:hypothetical protein